MKRSLENAFLINLPSSTFNTYPKDATNRDGERLQRWSVITDALQRGAVAKSICDVIHALEMVNPVERSTKFDYTGLENYLIHHKSVVERNKSIQLINDMSQLALQLPSLIPESFPVLCCYETINNTIKLDHLQVACLLCHGKSTTIPSGTSTLSPFSPLEFKITPENYALSPSL